MGCLGITNAEVIQLADYTRRRQLYIHARGSGITAMVD